MEWISIKDRLPEVGKRVLVYTEMNVIRIDRLRLIKNGKRKAATWESSLYVEVTHWMPLPEPPKEAKE